MSKKFTGVLDKNGEKIYAGDKVTHGPGRLYKVMWDNRLKIWVLVTPTGYTGLNPKYPPTLYKPWLRPRDAKGHFLPLNPKSHE